MTNYAPLISVIIPVYNCENYVGEAIDSVLNQPYGNIRIVLVDDGSWDSSPEICDRYVSQNKRVHVIHQQNGGVSKARNTGIEYVLAHFTDTDYIAFLDADDKWCADFFTQETLDLFKSSYDLISFQTARCNHSVTRYQRPHSMNEGLYNGGNRSVWLNAKQTFGAAFYSISVLSQYHLRFLESLKTNEDLIFSMQFKYLANSIYLHNKLLYLYRNNLSSVSHRRVDAISKYTPMIHAYIESDDLMASYRNDERGVLQEGYAMAAIYIVDVHEEHYRQLGTKKDLDRMMKQNHSFDKLITSPFAYNRPDSGLRWQKMQAHPVRFRLQCYARGIMSSTVRTLYLFLMRIPLIAKLLDKKRYPIAI